MFQTCQDFNKLAVPASPYMKNATRYQQAGYQEEPKFVEELEPAGMRIPIAFKKK